MILNSKEKGLVDMDKSVEISGRVGVGKGRIRGLNGNGKNKD